MLFQVTALVGLAVTAQAGVDAHELAKRAAQPGEIKRIMSTADGPLGVDGLWGLSGSFIADAGCQQAYDALRDIRQYPTHADGVKRVNVLEETDGSLRVEYTEGMLGLESTSTQLWRFKSAPVPTITSVSVGKEDPPSWLEMTLHDAGHPKYCEVNIRVFADMSAVPDFIMKWVSAMAAKQLAATYRSIIRGGVEQDKAGAPTSGKP